MVCRFQVNDTGGRGVGVKMIKYKTRSCNYFYEIPCKAYFFNFYTKNINLK